MRKLAVAIGVALLLTGCGDDGDDTPTGAGTGGAEAEAGADADAGEGGEGATAPPITARDFEFDPSELALDPGSTAVLTVANEGDSPHTFTSEELDVDEEIAPGDKIEVSVTVPDEGPVEFFCRFHRSRGMEGEILTEASSAGVPGGTSTSVDPDEDATSPSDQD